MHEQYFCSVHKKGLSHLGAWISMTTQCPELVFQGLKLHQSTFPTSLFPGKARYHILSSFNNPFILPYTRIVIGNFTFEFCTCTGIAERLHTNK